MGKFLGFAIVGLACAGRAWCQADLPLPAGATTNTAALVPSESVEGADIEARKFAFDKLTNIAVGDGDVTIKYHGAFLRADHVKFNQATKEAWASGNVRLNRNGQEWAAPVLYYNFETHAIRTDDLRGFFAPVTLRAFGVEPRGTNAYSFAQATATTCEYAQPHYRLEATHGTIYPDDRVVLYNVKVIFGNTPVFWFPVVIIPLKGDVPPVSVSVGDSGLMGAFILTSTHFHLNQDLDLTVHADERTKRGPGIGADLGYRMGSAGQGLVKGYYSSDGKPEDAYTIAEGKHITSDRYRASWQHKQTLFTDTDLTLSLTKWSDPNVTEDFFPREFQRESEPESVVDLTKRGENYTVSALARPQLNRFFAEVERLPEAKWAMNRTQLLGSPIYYEGETSGGYYNNTLGGSNEAAAGSSLLLPGSTMRFDTFHQLVSPQLLFGWLSVIPRAGGRYTYYERAPYYADTTNEVKRFVGDLGMETSFKLSREWNDVQSARWHIDGLRHIIEPFADYQWIPEPSVDRNSLFRFDTLQSLTITNSEVMPLTRYTAFEFPANNQIDDLQREDAVRFGLRQRLQTRRDGKPWDLVELTGWTEYHAERVNNELVQDINGVPVTVRPNTERDLSDLFGILEVRPFEWIALDAFTRYDMRQSVVREFNTAFHVGESDKWMVGVGTRLLDKDSNLLSTSLGWRLTRQLTVQTYHRIDMLYRKWEEMDYILRQELHDWYLDYGFRYRGEYMRPDEKLFFVALSLKAFPGLHMTMDRIDMGGLD